MLVSIITLTSNSEKTLEKTLQSIESQTYKNIEMVHVDNRSSDETINILKKYSNKNTKFVSEKDSGIANAFNKGLKMANGEIIGFLHSDDIFAYEDCVLEMVDCFRSEDINFFYADLTYVSNKKNIRFWKSDNRSGYKNRKKLEKKINFGWMPPHPTVFIKKELINEIGFYNENYRVSSDYDYLLRAIKNENNKPFYFDKNFVNMALGGNSNKSLKNIIKKMTEDYAIIKNNLNKGIIVLLLKNLRKISQFLIYFKSSR